MGQKLLSHTGAFRHFIQSFKGLLIERGFFFRVAQVYSQGYRVSEVLSNECLLPGCIFLATESPENSYYFNALLSGTEQGGRNPGFSSQLWQKLPVQACTNHSTSLHQFPHLWKSENCSPSLLPRLPVFTVGCSLYPFNWGQASSWLWSWHPADPQEEHCRILCLWAAHAAASGSLWGAAYIRVWGFSPQTC